MMFPLSIIKKQNALPMQSISFRNKKHRKSAVRFKKVY